MTDEYQSMAANAICHAATMWQDAATMWQDAAGQLIRPSTIYKPKLFVDGNQWCALFGENLQDGVAGFGKSPADAYADFDRNWWKTLP